MAFPAGLRVLGGGLTSVAEGLQAIPEYVDQDEELAQKRALRPLTLEEAKLRLEKSRESIHPPHFTSYGIYEYDPVQGTYTYTQSEEQKRHSAKEAEMSAIVLYGSYPKGTPQRDLYDAYISKMGAAGVNAQSRAAMVNPNIDKMKAQQQHWLALETQAKANGDARAKSYGDLARHYGDLATHYERQDDNTLYGINTRADTSTYGIDTRAGSVADQITSREKIASEKAAQQLVVLDERLKARDAEVKQRLAAAQAAGDKRGLQQAQADQARLERQRERLDFEREKLGIQEEGKDYRQGVGEEGKGTRLEQTQEFRAPGETARTNLNTSRLLHGINEEQRKEEKHQLTQQTGEAKLAEITTKNKYLDERQKAELARIQQQSEVLKTRGETMGPYLEARLQKLQDSITQAEERENRAAAKAPNDLAYKQEQLIKLQAQNRSPANQLRIKKLEAEIRELTSRADERGSSQIDVQTIGKRGEQITSRYRGKDAELYRAILGRMSGDAKKDAAMVTSLPRVQERLIARDAYQARYGKPLPPEAATELPATTPAQSSGELSTAQAIEILNQLGLPAEGSSDEKTVQEFHTRFQNMTPEEALERYKTLKSPEMKKAFKIAFVDRYKRKPPE